MDDIHQVLGLVVSQVTCRVGNLHVFSLLLCAVTVTVVIYRLLVNIIVNDVTLSIAYIYGIYRSD